ncbi:alanine/ornithine racemase family PLP-dependent enzyme [Pseudothermotoga thermarum]|uniref:Alanine racemase domain protein n=1 Tax=Pseudothermotoga thermarum DSM 5069 TaxID=688269 RepID=F7YYM6_9THEM|nr:alanine/ornithine racemase family PLP-dependent enzyme [Pseudothermotoga thermarum]AEH51058.1 alanine racemase domain protein [Pseudothermotoga thermarum DSM 5069]
MPFLEIHLPKVRENAEKVLSLCKSFGIEVVGVTKVSLGDPTLAEILRQAGIKIIAESRIQNIERLLKNGIEGPFMMIRVPPKSELEKVVQYCDYILVSEPQTVEWIEELAQQLSKSPKLIYMVDVGDLREGVWYKEAVEEIFASFKLCKKARIVGIGTNLGCYGGVIPTPETLAKLISVKEKLTEKGLDVQIVSGGATATLRLVEEGKLPPQINQLRIGEAIFLGTDVTNDRVIKWLNQDTFILKAEIIEIKTKPSVPEGEIGFDAFGRKPQFIDKGPRKRAILALGEQDTVPKQLIPLLDGAQVIHASSDHTLVDITECKIDLKLGDFISFRLSYAALLRAMTCPHVEKIYMKEE